MIGQASISNPIGELGQLVLLEEISHRVVNEYSAAIAEISMAAARTCDTKARAALNSAAARLRRYAAAHHALRRPETSDFVALGPHLERLCSALSDANLQDRGVRLVLQTDACALAADRCWRVGLICAELITNAARHGLAGGPGTITVRVACAGGHVFCSIIDDGKNAGLGKSGMVFCSIDDRRNAERGKSGLGTYVVQSLARELGGQVKWRFDADGVEALLAFPEAPSQSTA